MATELHWRGPQTARRHRIVRPPVARPANAECVASEPKNSSSSASWCAARPTLTSDGGLHGPTCRIEPHAAFIAQRVGNVRCVRASTDAHTGS